MSSYLGSQVTCLVDADLRIETVDGGCACLLTRRHNLAWTTVQGDLPKSLFHRAWCKAAL